MNKRAKRRLIIAGLVVVIGMIGAFALWGTGSTAQSLEVHEAASGAYEGKKVRVSGAVVQDSLSSQGSTVAFKITGEPGSADTKTVLSVSYSGALPATFGNGIVAICTGTVTHDTLVASSIVTKCPSKYESAQGALTVENLLEQKNELGSAEVKLAGYIKKDTLKPAGTSGPRFILESQGAQINVIYNDALSEEFTDNVGVVLTGSLDAEGQFVARDAAINADISR